MLSKKKEFGHLDLYLKSYFDGDVFGEQPVLMKNSNILGSHLQSSKMQVSEQQAKKLLLRDSTCISNEHCILLEVPNEVKLLIYSIAESSNEYEVCMNWLRKVPIFTNTQTFYLLQMMCGLEKRSYKYGEYLTKAGQQPDGMFLITKGQCLSIHETVGLKKVESSGQFARFQNQNKSFVFGGLSTEMQSPDQDKKRRYTTLKSDGLSNFNPQISVLNALKGNSNKNFQNTRLYLDDSGKHMPGHTAFKNNVIFSRLVPGDTFAVRTLLPQEEIIQRMPVDQEDYYKVKPKAIQCYPRKSTKKLLNNFQNNGGPFFLQSQMPLFELLVRNQKASALSIVKQLSQFFQFADSNEVEVLVLKPQMINYIPESQKEALYVAIAKTVDPDRPLSLTEILKRKCNMSQWEKIKHEIVENMRKCQFMERCKGVYKR